MKISTAEIKMLIRKCVESEGFYTADDFKKYINLHSKKEFYSRPNFWSISPIGRF